MKEKKRFQIKQAKNDILERRVKKNHLSYIIKTMPNETEESIQQQKTITIESSDPYLNGLKIDPEKYAQGGMAVLFFANSETGEPCVLKIDDTADETGESRIKAEVDTMRTIENLKIAPKVYGSGNVKLTCNQPSVTLRSIFNRENPAFAMETINGQSLYDIDMYGNEGELASLAPHVLATVAQAIDNCASIGLRHRDINTKNIMIETETNRLVLVDWGISTAVLRSEGLQVTYDGFYMPPEIGQLEKESVATDIFELAFLTYEMITASFPYGQVLIEDSYGAKRQFPVPKLWHDGGLTDTPYESLEGKNLQQINLQQTQIQRLDEVFKKAMSFEPTERYQSAVEFAIEVSTIIGETNKEWNKYSMQLKTSNKNS